MENKIFFLIVGFILLAWALQPVPYCNDIPKSELTSEKPDTIYSEQGVNEIRNELNQNGFITIQTFGNSMCGTIEDKSRCTCMKQDSYEVGDIILFFAENNQGIAHRIVYEDEEGFITKGDANNFLDSKISKGDVLCEIPYIRRFRLYG